MKAKILILLMIAFWGIVTSQNVTTLTLNKDLQVVIPPEHISVYQTILPAQIPSNYDFFFVVQWPSSDPLQYPFIDITYGEGNFMTCYNSNNQFSGLCSLPSSSLQPNDTITAQIYCFVQCKITITASLQKRLRMTLADMYKFTAPASNALPVEIEMPVSFDINFTQIAIYAQIQSMNKANQGLEMYANIGDQNTPIPTKSSYDQSGVSIYWGGKGIFLSKEDIKPGQFIKLFIYISQGMTVKIYGTYLFGNNFVIQLGKTYYDYTSYQESKLYKLDLRNASNTTGKTITIGFLIYSGNPYIKISMDSDFLKTLPHEASTSTTTYLITESLRAKYNFSGIIYILVESSWSSNYLLYTGTDQKNYAHIFPDIQLYNELEPKDVYNYFFDDLVTSTNATNGTLRSYSIRVDMLKGHITFGVRRCKSAEAGQSILNCVINQTDSIKNSTVKATFQEIDITMKQSESYYYMSFKYDATSCARLNVTANDTRFYCVFHIVALESDNITSDYTITLNKRLYTTTLMEGTLSRDFIYKDQYLFFKFMLGSLEEVVSVTFFSTVIEGDIYLIGSIQDQFPTMESQQGKITFSAGSTLTISKDKLAKNIYISTYGIELSEFSLGVKVTRQAKIITNATNTTNKTSNNQTSQTKLTLKLDLSQEYVLQQVDTSATFLISAPQILNITVEIIQLAGSVNLQIQDSNNKTVNYIDKKITNNKLSYTFQASAKAVYSALVTANKGDTQKFIILYHKQDVCLSYSLNLPLYLSLSKGEKNCITYTLTKMVQLEVTASVPLQNLIDRTLKMAICINSNCLPFQTSHHAAISKNQLNSYCNSTKFNNSNVFQSCLIKLTFDSNTSIDFQVIVEEQGKDIGLFDGIVEKVNTYDLTHEKGKYFYYEIYDWSAVKIFFTSLTSNSYYVALKFVEEKSFLTNSSNIYLPYRQTNYDLKQKLETNFFETIVYGSNTNIFTISSAIIDKFCDQCFLTIAVYPLYTFQHSLAYFQIEVTQTQTVLFLGSTKLGHLEADQIYNYQLQVSQSGDALLSIKDLSKQSNRQKDCFSASITQQGSSASHMEDGLVYIKKGSKTTNLYVQATSDYCSYQVTYTRVDFPLIIASSNQLYRFDKAAAGKLFMIYTHNTPVSFKITQIINAGTLSVYASPIVNKTISQLISSDLQTFAFVNVDKNRQFLVSNSSSKFCSNCQYLIVLDTQSAIVSQIIISNLDSSIPLSVNGIIKEKVVVSELSIRNYTFNSVSAFNVTISPLYGKLNVIIIDPTKKQSINVNISTTQVFAIPHNKQTEDFSFDFNSYYTRYSINIEALFDSSYTIKASKQALTSRLFQGIPFYYTFTADQTIILQFLNLKTASATSNSLNLLVDMVELKTNITPNANVSALFQSKEGENPINIPITSFTKSDSVYNIEIPLKVGTYYIKLTLDKPAKVSIILAKQSLIHLRPSSNAIMFKQGVFELYSSQKSAMIEIFTCWGDIKVDASSHYKDFSSKEQQYGQIILQQNNYGGHYVINAEYIYGQYFIKVSNRQKHQTEMGYLITYYYYDRKDVLPYKLIDMVSREITYTLTKTQVKFTFNPVTIDWDISDSIESVFVEYRIYISDNKNKVSKYANCRLGDIYWGYGEEKEGVVSASLDIDKISEIVNNQDIYFVGAEAIVFIEASKSANEDYPEELNLIYETIELTNVRMPAAQQQTGTSYSVQIIILWFLLPFAIAGVILYFALKYCIRKYRGLVPNELMQESEGYGSSEQGVAIPDSSPIPENPNNASQSMKQQV